MNNGYPDTGKSPFASKTVWLGVVTALTPLLSLLLPDLRLAIDSNWEPISLGLGALILWLRIITGRPIKFG